MSTIIKPKRATQEEVAASTKVLSKDEILLATPNEGSPSGKLKLYRGDGVTPANELPVGIDGELGDDLRISAFDESNAKGNAEIEAGASLSRLFGNIRRKFAQVQSEADDKVNSSNGDISNTVIGSVDAIEDNFPEPAAGESVKTYFGKVKKFIADFNSFKNGIITLGRLANNADTTVEGFALDARMGKTLGDRVAQLNSDLGEVNSNLETMVVKNYSDSNTPNAHTRISVHADKSVHIVSDYGVTSLISNADIIVKEFRKTGISVTANTITGINMDDVIQVPSGYRLAAVTPTLSGTRATGMLVSCNQRNYTFFPIYSIAESSDIILDVNCIFIRQ